MSERREAPAREERAAARRPLPDAPGFAVALTLAIALAVPAILLADGLRLVTGDWYVRAVYAHGSIPKDDLGLNGPQRTSLALTGLHSIRPDEKDGLDLLRRARLPDGAAAFNAREIRHMSNVRTLLGRLYTLQLAAAGVIVVLGLALALRPARRLLVPRALRLGALLTLGLAALVGLLSVVYWPAFSTPFHLLFFGESSWRFDDTDTLRRLYPDQFWIDTAIVLGVLAVVQAAALWLVARVWERRAQGGRSLAANPAA